MATTKITDLTAYTDPVNTDVLPIVDITSDVTKKVSIANVMKNASLGTAALPGIAFDGDPNTGIYSPGADQVSVTTGGTERLRIDAAGQIEAVSLGTAAAPTYSFTTDPNTGIYSPGADQVAISTNGTGRLFVDADGDVGIGVSNPLYALHVISASSSAARIGNSGANNTQLLVGNSAGDTSVRTLSTGDGIIYSDSGKYLAFGSNGGTERMRLRSDGTFEIKGGGVAGTTPAVSVNTSASANSLVIDSSGRVGLGTSSPSTKLSVVGTLGSLSEAIRVNSSAVTQSSSSGLWLLGNQSTSHYNWLIASQYNVGAALEITPSTATDGSTFSTPTAVFTQTGRVGIGTTSPGTNLNVVASGAGGKGGEIIISNSSARQSGNYAQLGFAPNSDYGGTVVCGFIRGLDTGGSVGNPAALTFGVGSGGSPTERMRLDESGRLLVGTSSTSTLSRAIIHGNSGGSGGTGILYLAIDSSSPSDGTRLGSLRFSDNRHVSTNIDGSTPAEIAAIRDGGTWTSGSSQPTRLVFSTTADGASSPTERTRIDSTGTHNMYSINDTIYARTNRGAGTSYVTFAGVHSATGTTNGTASCYIYSNGNIQNTNGSYTTLSDVKLKENIVDAGSQWDDLKAIQIRNWNFKEETGHETHRQIGPIAQELEQVCPGLVFETPDRDADGNETGEVTKGVNQSVLYMKAVKALQEAMERIEALEAKVAALEAS